MTREQLEAMAMKAARSHEARQDWSNEALYRTLLAFGSAAHDAGIEAADNAYWDSRSGDCPPSAPSGRIRALKLGGK